MVLNEEYEKGRKEYTDKKCYITHELVGRSRPSFIHSADLEISGLLL